MSNYFRCQMLEAWSSEQAVDECRGPRAFGQSEVVMSDEERAYQSQVLEKMQTARVWDDRQSRQYCIG